MSVLRYIDVCSGISAPTAAWKSLSWTALCYAEVDDAPRAVLTHHYPQTPLHGDFTEIRGDEYGPVDLLVGGTPCQSFSISGLRGGLADDRGNLALEYLRLADRARPRWLVWENVPGVLSSNGGRDFGAITGGMAELGYGFAYRILDAQYFGVPQRRRRVFVVGHLGDWQRAGAVLFERHSLSGHPEPRAEKAEGIAARTGTDSEGKVRATDEVGVQPRAQAVIYQASEFGIEAYPTAGTLRAGRIPAHQIVIEDGRARYLTPRECERLTGFPDDFTLVPYRRRMMADGPRYRMLGNSMAVPVMRWLGERIAKADRTIGSVQHDGMPRA